MDVLAILCVRDEVSRIANCLTHLIENGVRYAVIDHASTDGTLELLREPRFRSNLEALVTMPWDGHFHLGRQMETKQEIVDRVSADWFVHLDADEIMQSCVDGETVGEAIARIDRNGHNTIDFNEFLFLPIDKAYKSDVGAWQEMADYYFFEPKSPRLLRAIKAGSGLSFRGSTGHRPYGATLNYPEERLILRHYAFVDQAHAYEKYVDRVFSADELARGLHSNRVGYDREAYRFPSRSTLKTLAYPASRDFDRSDPKKSHYWQWAPANLDQTCG